MPWQTEVSLRGSGSGSQGSIPREKTSKLGTGERATFLGRKAARTLENCRGNSGMVRKIAQGHARASDTGGGETGAPKLQVRLNVSDMN